MASSQSFDVIVIGAGPGGYVTAIRLAQFGKSVAVVERDAVGGTCLNWGCIPSKALIHAATLAEQMQSASTMGIHVKDVSVNMAELQDWKSGVVKKLTGGIGQLFKSHNITSITGTATFTGPNTIQVVGKDGKETLEADHIIIATGSSSIELPHLPLDGKSVVDSKDALEWTEVPKRLAIVGGGVIGLEIGVMYAKLGSEVTVVEMLPQLLAGTDPDVAQQLARSLKKRKLTIHTEAKAQGLTVEKDGTVSFRFTPKKKDETTITVDKVLVAVGRRPNTGNLGLDKAGVQVDPKGFIQVNNQLRTTNPNIFAIGDVVGGPLLAHKASKEGLIVADILNGDNEIVDVRAMPAAVFTDPEVATVGMTEAQAIEQGFTVKSGKFPFQASGRALTMNEAEGFVKIISDADTDRVLGVHMVGPHVAELLGEAALAIEMGATTEDIALTVHTHPTLTETLMEAAEAVHQKAIHIFVPKAGGSSKKTAVKS